MNITERLSHNIYGQGPQLVLLHGLMGSAANWMKVSNALMSEFEVLVFDQRGHGHSYHPERGFSPEDFAQDLLDLLDELGWERPHLLGHSMGGRNALVFAADHPHRVQKLIVEDIGPDANQMNVHRMHRMFDAIPTPFADRKLAREYFYEKFAAGPGVEFDNAETLAKSLFANLRKTEEGQWDWRFSLQGVLGALREGRAVEKWDKWKTIQAPTLLMRGQNSVELPPEIYRRMLEELPQCQGVEFEGCGHWLHFEQPERFLKTVVEFLRE